jgi:glycosyltransferase involved in cell wall biosynthesis
MEKIIYTTDCHDYVSGPTKFGICMATYQRKSGRSPSYLKRSLDALLAQTATNWHLYLVGDKYEDNTEFMACIASFPKEKITAVNLPTAPERENIVDKKNLWKVAGSNAFNHAHKMALDDGCDYIIHHDDDDVFHIKKIQLLNYIISIYAHPLCIFHYSMHLQISLPRQIITEIKSSTDNLNYLPCPSNVNHSALTIHNSVARSFNYNGFAPGKISYQCGDIQLLEYIRNTIYNNREKYTVFIPLVLCTHDVEGEARL